LEIIREATIAAGPHQPFFAIDIFLLPLELEQQLRQAYKRARSGPNNSEHTNQTHPNPPPPPSQLPAMLLSCHQATCEKALICENHENNSCEKIEISLY
jgi:hypothetical protein